MKRSSLKSVILAGIVAVACWNIQAYTRMVLNLPPREVNNPVRWESAWEPIHSELIRSGYRMGDLGYVTARSLRGEPAPEAEGVSWAELRYTVIPFNLVLDKMDAPFVLGDFTREKPAELPPGLLQVYNPGNGLVLLRSTANQ